MFWLQKCSQWLRRVPASSTWVFSSRTGLLVSVITAAEVEQQCAGVWARDKVAVQSTGSLKHKYQCIGLASEVQAVAQIVSSVLYMGVQ